MNVHELKKQFLLTKKYQTEDVNELLDFIKRCYIRQEIPYSDYRQMLKSLERMGARCPDREDDRVIKEPIN